MQNIYHAIVKQDDGWWIGWIEEIPGVNCQERTEEELLESLRVTLREALEFNRDEALKAADSLWKEEILWRVQEIDMGAVKMIAWPEVKRQLSGR
jgi:predicted RNase H-like HicB family nuclease